MYKNLLKSITFAALAIVAGACAKEQVASGNGDTVEATFNVDVPETTITTKGLSDAASVNELICQVFLNDGNYTPVPDLNQTVELKNKKAKVTFNLVKGQKYSFAFWAQVKGTGYYNTGDLRAVKMNVDAVKANDPAMDAYFAQKDFSALSTPVTDIKKNTVPLYRAVAQVNFGTINSDRADKLEVVKSKIKLTEVPTVFDVVRGNKDDAYSVPATIEFKENVLVEEKLLVAGNEYDYVSTCYVFAYNAQKLTDATATFWVGSTSRTVSAPNAPYKRNMRTNILGDLLTINQDFNIVLDPNFKGGDKTYDAVSANLEAGKEVTLLEDYFVADKSKGVTLDVGVTSVLNLNGKKFSNENGLKDNKAALQVHGDLTINGDGKVYCEGYADNNAIIVEQGGHLVINGGTYNVGANTDSGKSNATIFVMGPDKYGRNGSVEINGGVFMAEAGSDFVLNQHDDITGNCFSVKGGTFVGFNPADNNADGEHTNYVAEGYRVVTTTYNGKQAWKVEAIPPVTTQEAFESAIATANSTVVLAAGTYTMPSTVADGVSITGSDASTSILTLNAAAAWHGVNATLKNVTIKSPNANYIGIQHAASIKYENCVIEGQPFSYANNAVFEKCTFNQTSPDAYNIWTYGSSNITFNNCVFNCAGKSVLIYNEGALPTGIVTLNKCKFIASQSVTGKAAIEIDSRFSSYEVYINDCTNEGFANGSISGNSLWNKKDGDKSVKIVVNGTQVL